MRAAIVSIGPKRRGFWSLLEIARPGDHTIPYGILLAGQDVDDWGQRFRRKQDFQDLDEDEGDVLEVLDDDFRQKAREMGAIRLLESLEDSLSGFFRISDREPIAYANPQQAVDGLFSQHVDSRVVKFETHLPLYGLRAAATKFGEGMEIEEQEEDWVLAPQNLRLREGMFVARVVGRSMEPLIADDALCIFRTPVTGSRFGRNLLIEKFDETDFAARYTVKRYARQGALSESADREAPIRLEPLNPAFQPFDLTSDRFHVVAEFVQVLYS